MTGTEICLVAALVVALIALVALILRSSHAEKASSEAASQLRMDLAEEMRKGRQEMSGELSRIREEVGGRLDASTRSTGERLDGSSKLVGERLDAVTKRIGDIGKELAAMGEAHRQIRELAKDISGLQAILQPPKSRGSLGELLLANALGEVMPAAQFALQHTFRDGTRVDAVIRLGDKLVPVDSKFPLDSFRRLVEATADEDRKRFRRDFERDVKKRIDETASYIRPGEGTFDFALMYVPAENVYYEAVLREEGEQSLSSYARERKVVPVSPNSLYAYLQAIALGLRGLKVGEHVEQVLAELGRLGREFAVFAEEYRVIGTHLKNASGKYDEGEAKLSRLAGRLERLESIEADDHGAAAP